MGMFYGSMTHSYSGKKRKTSAWKRKSAPRKCRTESLRMESHISDRMQEINAHRERYPSYVSDVSQATANCVVSDDSYKQEISKNYTVAPAYNKGAYQVINKSNIKDIGR
jgi:hypothetical protein